jgi:hypothetical protein
MISDRAPKIRDERLDSGAERLETRGAPDFALSLRLQEATSGKRGAPRARSSRGIMSATAPTYKSHQSYRSHPLQPDALFGPSPPVSPRRRPYHPYAHPFSRKAMANIRVRKAPTIVTTTPTKISRGCRRSASHCKKTEKTKPQITAISG